MSVTQVAAANNSNHYAIPEISDEELRQMALVIENNQYDYFCFLLYA